VYLRGSALIFLFCFAATAAKPTYEKGELIKERVYNTHVTQAVVGKKEIDFRIEEIEMAAQEEILEELKLKKPGKVIVGPKNQLWTIDGHHFGLSLLNSGRSKMYFRVWDDWSHLSKKRFIRAMEKKNFFYRGDENGDELPLNVIKNLEWGDLVDDPYRSLAYFVRKGGGYRKRKTAFQEFKWGDAYRNRQVEIKKWLPAVEASLGLAHRREMLHLPGWVPQRIKLECDYLFHRLGRE
jgi:hypothetical protein